MKTRLVFLVVVLIFGALFGYYVIYFAHVHVNNQYYLVANITRIIDGDTFEVYIYNTSTSERIRLKCIDYPDIYDEKRKHKWYALGVNDSYLKECYYEGISFLKDLLLYKNITIIQDKKYERDKYGRLLGYVIFNRTDINKLLIENGYAIPYMCDKYKEYFKRRGCLWEKK